MLCNDDDQIILKCQKWENELAREIHVDDFRKEFININKVTNVPKLRSFQYRLLHRAIITNIHLNRWGKIESDGCSFCHKSSESYSHLFATCTSVVELWEKVQVVLKEDRPKSSGYIPGISN